MSKRALDIQSVAEKMQKSGLTEHQLKILPTDFDWFYRHYLSRQVGHADAPAIEYKKEWEQVYDAIKNRGYIVRLRDKDRIEGLWRLFNVITFTDGLMGHLNHIRRHKDLLDAERRDKLDEFYKDYDDARRAYGKLMPLVESEYMKHNEAKMADLDAEEDGSAVFSPENFVGNGMRGSGQGASRPAGYVVARPRQPHDDYKDAIELEIETVKDEYDRLMLDDLPDAIGEYPQYTEQFHLLGRRAGEAHIKFLNQSHRRYYPNLRSGLTDRDLGDVQEVAMDAINTFDDLRNRMEVFKRRGEAERVPADRYIPPTGPRYAAGAGKPKRGEGRSYTVL
jgi:hypothetical protein